jgi:hypothetical protein
MKARRTKQQVVFGSTGGAELTPNPAGDATRAKPGIKRYEPHGWNVTLALTAPQCDEKRPVCGQCDYSSHSCTFNPILVQHVHSASSCASQPGEDLGKETATRLDGPHVREGDPKAPNKTVENSELLDHFVQTVDYIWIGSALLQTTLQKHGPKLALRSPYLLHAMLSFSAYHIAYIRPAAVQYNLAGTSHYGMSLQAYSAALECGLENADIDAIFSCCMLLNLIAFKSLADARPEMETPGCADELNLDIPALLSIRGFQIIQRDPRVESRLDECIWNDIFQQCIAPTASQVDNRLESLRAIQLMEQLEKLCETGDGLDPGKYDHALDSLRLLMQRGIGQKTIGVLFRFTQAIDGEFLWLLEDLDYKALLLLYYWLSMAAEINQWWALEPARSESMKLFKFLKEHGQPEDKDFLDFPTEIILGH